MRIIPLDESLGMVIEVKSGVTPEELLHLVEEANRIANLLGRQRALQYILNWVLPRLELQLFERGGVDFSEWARAIARALPEIENRVGTARLPEVIYILVIPFRALFGDVGALELLRLLSNYAPTYATQIGEVERRIRQLPLI